MNANLQPDSAARRSLLKAVAAGVGAMAIAPGYQLFQTAQAKADEKAVSAKVRWGLLIHTELCPPDCNDCVTACQQEHGWGEGSSDETLSNIYQKAQWIRKVEAINNETLRSISMPVMCQHCEDAPCVDVCPTGASFRRDDGIVMVDKHSCIGCRYCVVACPYQARSFVHEDLSDQRSHSPRGKGVVESCNLCAHRIDKNQQPACVQACPHGVMVFGDLNNPDSEISTILRQISSEALRPELNLNTGVRYTGLQREPD